MTEVQAIPEGYQRVTPYLCVHDANAALLFYTTVLGARERMRMPMSDGKIVHAELEIGDSIVMLSDEAPEADLRSPKTLGGSAVIINLYVDDVDSTFNRALHEGAKSVNPVENQFYGDRAGQFEDPFGHRWNIATHVEDVSPEEMSRRMAEITGS